MQQRRLDAARELGQREGLLDEERRLRGPLRSAQLVVAQTAWPAAWGQCTAAKCVATALHRWYDWHVRRTGVAASAAYVAWHSAEVM
jgi:hypothetical protein